MCISLRSRVARCILCLVASSGARRMQTTRITRLVIGSDDATRCCPLRRFAVPPMAHAATGPAVHPVTSGIATPGPLLVRRAEACGRAMQVSGAGQRARGVLRADDPAVRQP